MEFNQSKIQYRQQLKVVNENVVGTVKKHFPALINSMNLYTVRAAELRDAGDIMVKSIEKFSLEETSPGKEGLSAFAECFKEIQDKRHEHVTNIEKIYEHLYKYKAKCKETNLAAKNGFAGQVNDLRKSLNERRRSATREQLVAKKEDKNETTVSRRQSDEGRNNSGTILPRRRIIAEKNIKKNDSDSESDSGPASSESDSESSESDSESEDESEKDHENETPRDSLEAVYDTIKEFERDKITDMKFVLGELVMSEMNFFSKALQTLTDGYQTIMNIDEDDCVEHVHQSLNYTAHGISRIPN